LTLRGWQVFASRHCAACCETLYFTAPDACSAATEPGSQHETDSKPYGWSIPMKQAVSPDELTDAEVESYAQAVDIFRASPTSPGFFTSTPVRDEEGRLCEVRFYGDNKGQQPLAVIGISDDGALLPMTLLT
jgi:hypothetical protein